MRKCTKHIPYLFALHINFRNTFMQSSVGSIQQNSLQTLLHPAGEFQKDVQIFCSKIIRNIFFQSTRQIITNYSCFKVIIFPLLNPMTVEIFFQKKNKYFLQSLVQTKFAESIRSCCKFFFHTIRNIFLKV